MITGNTPEEMGENCKRHAMQMMQQGDTAHIAAGQKMMKMSPDDFQKFMTEFQRKFAEAEEA